MNITKERIDNLNATLKIKLAPEDYKQRVDTEIRKHQRNARVPGFRPGKVPEGMIRKMYGKAILADELNKILSESLNRYLSENKIEILGNPLPKSNDSDIDWENPSELEFLYDLGLAPEINLNLSATETFDYYMVRIDDEMFNRYQADIRRKYGKFSNPETSEPGDILYGDFEELNADGSAKEDGIKNTSTIALEFIKNEGEQQKFIGLKQGDVIVFNPAKAVDNITEMAGMLGVTKETAEEIRSDFRYTVKTINRIEKAELNQELFDKIYGTGIVTTEAEFNDRVREDIKSLFRADSDRKLKSDIVERLLAQTNVALPDSFLKRWLLAANEKPVTPEQIEEEYDSYAKGLKWRLVENTIIKDNNIQVTPEELKEFAKQMIRNQFAQYGQMNMDDDTLNGMVDRYLGKEEQVRKMYENLADQKVFEFLRSTVTLREKEVSYDEFIKAVSTF
jgi:trigger factor